MLMAIRLWFCVDIGGIDTTAKKTVFNTPKTIFKPDSHWYYSTFEANTIDAHHNALGNDEDNNSDDESYVDDYLKMMKD